MNYLMESSPATERTKESLAPFATPLVQVRKLTMAFGDHVVQRNLDFDVLPGEVLAIAGGSACGKSTLLRHMIGLQVPAAGQVLYGKQDLYAAQPARRRTLMQTFDMSPAQCEQEARFKLARP